MVDTSELDYESIENAVMETARGRWFLTEFKKRNTGTDTKTLLDAISRLEKVITSMNTPAAAPAAQASPSPEKPEPQKDLQKDLSPQNMQYFKKDEDLFEATPSAPASPKVEKPGIANAPKPKLPLSPAPAPQPAPKAAAPCAPQEPKSDLNDRFKVFKLGTTENSTDKSAASSKPEKSPKAETTPAKPEPAEKPSPTEASSSKKPQDAAKTASPSEKMKIPDPAMTPTKEEKDRIVVIRKTSGAEVDIPLQNDTSDGDHPDTPPAA